MFKILTLKNSKLLNNTDKSKAKDEEAFGALVNLNKNKLYRIGKGILKSEFDVEDAIQETILKAWLNIDKLKNKDSFTPWIARILVNECYGIIRKRENNLEIDDNIIISPDNTAKVDNKLDVWQALDKLNVDFRIPLILYFFEDFSYEEIASILKLPQGTVKSRISRGKEKLEGILINYGGGKDNE